MDEKREGVINKSVVVFSLTHTVCLRPNLGTLQGEVAEVAGATGANDPLVDAEDTAEVDVCEREEGKGVGDILSNDKDTRDSRQTADTPTAGGHVKVGREFAVGEAVLHLQAGDAMWGGKGGGGGCSQANVCNAPPKDEKKAPVTPALSSAYPPPLGLKLAQKVEDRPLTLLSRVASVVTTFFVVHFSLMVRPVGCRRWKKGKAG